MSITQSPSPQHGLILSFAGVEQEVAFFLQIVDPFFSVSDEFLLLSLPMVWQFFDSEPVGVFRPPTAGNRNT